MRRKARTKLPSTREAYRRFNEVGGFQLAASISFYALMSMIPLLFMTINIAGYFLERSKDLRDAVVAYLRTVYPLLGATLTREVDRVVANHELGWLGIIFFLWLGSLVFTSLEYSINTIFRAKKRRHFLVTTIISFSMVMLSGLSLAASFWQSYIPKFIIRHGGEIAQTRAVQFLAHSLIAQVLPLFMVFLSFTLIYKILPNRKVRLMPAVQGGLIAACLWELAKVAFVWYVTSVVNPGIYGSLSTIVVFLLWVFYSAVILLFVAELVCIPEKGEKA